jgi:hypothetical protein
MKRCKDCEQCTCEADALAPDAADWRVSVPPDPAYLSADLDAEAAERLDLERRLDAQTAAASPGPLGEDGPEDGGGS